MAARASAGRKVQAVNVDGARALQNSPEALTEGWDGTRKCFRVHGPPPQARRVLHAARVDARGPSTFHVVHAAVLATLARRVDRRDRHGRRGRELRDIHLPLHPHAVRLLFDGQLSCRHAPQHVGLHVAEAAVDRCAAVAS